MDSPINSDFPIFSEMELAKNLLATCPQFEPFVPLSHQNGIRNLDFLEGLAQLTLQNIETKKLLLDSLYPHQHPAPTSKTQSKPPQKLTKDQVLTQALLKLRESKENQKRSLRRSPGIYHPILRSNSE